MVSYTRAGGVPLALRHDPGRIRFGQVSRIFANKVIDAADVYSPMTHQLEQQKLAVRLVDPDDILSNMVVGGQDHQHGLGTRETRCRARFLYGVDAGSARLLPSLSWR